MSQDWLEKEVAALTELLPTAPEGRGRLILIRRMLEMLHELHERSIAACTGRNRPPPSPPATKAGNEEGEAGVDAGAVESET